MEEGLNLLNILECFVNLALRAEHAAILSGFPFANGPLRQVWRVLRSGRAPASRGWFFPQAAETITAHLLETKLEAARRENHWAPATVNHHHTAVSLSFRLAIAKDKAKENPARKIRRGHYSPE